MPFHEPPRQPDPTEIDIDMDVDVFLEPSVEDPDAEQAARHKLETEGDPVFRTPEPGAHLTREQLEEDLGGDAE